MLCIRQILTGEQRGQAKTKGGRPKELKGVATFCADFFIGDEQCECAHVTTLPAKAHQHTALVRVGCKAVQRLFVDLSRGTETIAVT